MLQIKMASPLVFYVCAIGLCKVIEARHCATSIHTSKESLEDIKENDLPYELNNRIEEEIDTTTIQNDDDDLRPSKLGPSRLGDNLLPKKAYRTRRHAKCARSKHRSCNILRYRISGDYEWERALRQRELMRVWSNQLRVVEKFIDHMKEAQRKRKKKSDFDRLIEEIEMKRTRITTEKSTTTTEEAITEVLHIIDETEVRAALKSNPLIKRMLGINRRKREKFFKKMNKSNITNDFIIATID